MSFRKAYEGAVSDILELKGIKISKNDLDGIVDNLDNDDWLNDQIHSAIYDEVETYLKTVGKGE